VCPPHKDKGKDSGCEVDWTGTAKRGAQWEAFTNTAPLIKFLFP
jgi:hypothetical protein